MYIEKGIGERSPDHFPKTGGLVTPTGMDIETFCICFYRVNLLLQRKSRMFTKEALSLRRYLFMETALK